MIIIIILFCILIYPSCTSKKKENKVIPNAKSKKQNTPKPLNDIEPQGRERTTENVTTQTQENVTTLEKLDYEDDGGYDNLDPNDGKKGGKSKRRGGRVQKVISNKKKEEPKKKPEPSQEKLSREQYMSKEKPLEDDGGYENLDPNAPEVQNDGKKPGNAKLRRKQSKSDISNLKKKEKEQKSGVKDKKIKQSTKENPPNDKKITGKKSLLKSEPSQPQQKQEESTNNNKSDAPIDKRMKEGLQSKTIKRGITKQIQNKNQVLVSKTIKTDENDSVFNSKNPVPTVVKNKSIIKRKKSQDTQETVSERTNETQGTCVTINSEKTGTTTGNTGTTTENTSNTGSVTTNKNHPIKTDETQKSVSVKKMK